MTNPERLRGILFIALPDGIRGAIGDFILKPNVLMPVDTGSETADQWDPGALSVDSLVAGCLKVLAWEPDHKDADYFRGFITAVRPKVSSELTDAAIVKAKNRDFDIAEEIFRALVGYQPNNSRNLLNLAILYENRAETLEQLGRHEQSETVYAQAFRYYTEALDQDEVVHEAYLYAGYFHIKQRNYELAREMLEQFLARDPESAHGEKVRSALRTIERQNLDDELFREAFDFIKLGKEEEGIDKARQFLLKNPGVWNAWFLLGWGLRKLQKWQEACDALKMALDHGGQQADTYNELAICHMELGNLKEAQNDLEHALNLDPENIKILSNFGILKMKQEDLEQAIACFRMVLDLEPDDPLALQYIDELSSR